MRKIELDMEGKPILELGDKITDFTGATYIAKNPKQKNSLCEECKFDCIERKFNCEANNIILVEEE